MSNNCDHFYVFLVWTSDGKHLRLQCEKCRKMFKVTEAEYNLLEYQGLVKKKFVPPDLRTW